MIVIPPKALATASPTVSLEHFVLCPSLGEHVYCVLQLVMPGCCQHHLLYMVLVVAPLPSLPLMH